jgi:hypothetical protein
MTSENEAIYQVAANTLADKTPVKTTYHFPLTGAYLCVECDTVTNNSQACPSCTSHEGLMPLSSIVKSMGMA